MSLTRLFVFLVLASLIFGCAGYATKLNDVRLGMTRDEVIQVMGKPNHVSAKDEVEFLNYNLLSEGIFSDEYFIRLKEGKVDVFGRRGDFGVLF